MDHLLLSEAELKSQSVEFFKINRGGDITYHGPGQITGYPILDLDEFFTDVHKYVRMLEEMIIVYIKRWGLQGIRIEGYTGVWLPPDEKSPFYRKICAIGVHLSRWVSMHGFAFNVNTDVSYFDRIIPCGIADDDKKVTSLSLETGQNFDLKVVGDELWDIFAELFNCDIVRYE
jgi:lipoyl(octanoyl) transferase